MLANDEATHETRRPRVAALIAVLAATVLAACGSTGLPFGAATDGGPLLQYALCMRAHDLPNFPDPTVHAGLAIPNDIDPRSPAFLKAQRACGKLAQAPEGQGGSPESRRLQLLALARCMRLHGVPSFPDPASSPPPPGSGNVIGASGSYLALGTSRERQSPAYKRAAAACGGIG